MLMKERQIFPKMLGTRLMCEKNGMQIVSVRSHLNHYSVILTFILIPFLLPLLLFWLQTTKATMQIAESEQPTSAPTNSSTGQRNIAFSTSHEPKNLKRPNSTSIFGYGGGLGGPRKRLDFGRKKDR